MIIYINEWYIPYYFFRCFWILMINQDRAAEKEREGQFSYELSIED